MLWRSEMTICRRQFGIVNKLAKKRTESTLPILSLNSKRLEFIGEDK